MRASAGDGSAGFSNYFAEQIKLARSEIDWGSRERALEIWRRMHAQFPDLTLKSEKAFNVFIDIGSLDEAEALIQAGRKRYPRYRSVHAAAFARVAYRRGDFEEALRRYEIVRRKFPWVIDSYDIAAACLSDLGRHDEAEEMLKLGVRKHPDNFELCRRYAQAATRRTDWPEGLRRWRVLSNRQEIVGFLGEAECLRQIGRPDEADVVLTDACERFRGNSYPFVEAALLSASRGNLQEAVDRWKTVLDRFPGHESAYPKAAEAYRKNGQAAQADEVLRIGVTRFPTNLAIHLEYARNAHHRGDPTAECERWALVRERFPTCAEARQQETAAQQHGSSVLPA